MPVLSVHALSKGLTPVSKKNAKTNMRIVTPQAPLEVIHALCHVRQHHPNVNMVVYKSDTRWRYMNADGLIPTLGSNIDVGILEAAQAALTKFPCVFEIIDPEEDTP